MGKKTHKRSSPLKRNRTFLYQWVNFEAEFDDRSKLGKLGGNRMTANHLRAIERDAKANPHISYWLVAARRDHGQWSITALMKVRPPTSEDTFDNGVLDKYVYFDQDASGFLALPGQEPIFDSEINIAITKDIFSNDTKANTRGMNGFQFEIPDIALERLRKAIKLSLRSRLNSLPKDVSSDNVNKRYLLIDSESLTIEADNDAPTPESPNQADSLPEQGDINFISKEPQSSSIILEMLDGQSWDQQEVNAVVVAYFDVLALEMKGEKFNPSARNYELQKILNNRNHDSIERKYQNISAVLDTLGLPFIRGYEPSREVQGIFGEAVETYIAEHEEEMVQLMRGYDLIPPIFPDSTEDVEVDPPISDHDISVGTFRKRVPRKLDFSARDFRNRLLGSAGEEWVVKHEQRRLKKHGLVALADRVEWTAKNLGDGTGFDIQSFNENGSEIYIEVKTTNCGINTPFLVTKNEVDFSVEKGGAFYIYRVFDFSGAPKLYRLQGSLRETADLSDHTFKALPKRMTSNGTA